LSPILVRPVREQLEHDRVIRLLQAKYKRKFEVAINPGNQQTMPVGTGPSPWYPDLVLQSQERSRKLMGVVEVETAESVNNLEAMSQWAALSKLRAPFHLYVPSGSADVARRLCADLQIPVAEVWAYHWLGDQPRFTLIHRDAAEAASAPARPPARAAAAAASGNGAAKTAERRKPTPARRTASPERAARPARKAAKTTRTATTRTAASRAAKAAPARSRTTRSGTANRAQKRK
jgi:hypothetical protein